MKAGKVDSHKTSAPVSEERTEEYYKKRPCAELCGIAAEIFQKFLDEQSVRDTDGGESRSRSECSDRGTKRARQRRCSCNSPTREAGNAQNWRF